MSEPLRILSLGAGVQSSTVLLMSLSGVLPRLDCAIFADTGWEPAAVYQHLEWLESVSSIPIIRVSAGNIRQDHLAKEKFCGNGRAPFYVLNPKPKSSRRKRRDGRTGKLPRQCTHDYKIVPVERKIKELLGLSRRARWPIEHRVDHWFGISVEEHGRCRFSGVAWKAHRYPLIFDLHKAYTRHDCKLWCQGQGYPIPPRSSCVGCPLHSNSEWRALRPAEFADACEFDAAIRSKSGTRGEIFLHRSCQALVQVDLSTDEERGQVAMLDSECVSGYCGT
jgi:hypothetical protein